jgi:hypothetical protein
MVDPAALDDLMEVAQKFFPTIKVMETPQQQERRQEPEVVEPLEDGTYGTIANLLRASSTETLKKLFRLMAVDLHPDRGGDVETMKKLNTAWDRIRMERGIR